MANPTNIIESPNTDAQMNSKRRRKKSQVWQHFTIETIDATCTKARCMQCKKSFAYISGKKLAGTSHLKRHISLGICPAGRTIENNGQIMPYIPFPSVNSTQDVIVNDLPRKRQRSTSGSTSSSLYHDRCRHDIAKMIIMHEYPLNVVECSAFMNCVKALQPQFPVVPIDVIEQDCIRLYQREKQNLFNVIDSIMGRVNLSLDMLWSNDQSVGYAVITGQFIDYDWKLHRRILSVVVVPFPDSDSALNHAFLSCITDWNLENKLFGITLDESSANKDARENLKRLLSVKNPLILNGKLLTGSCYARVLCQLAHDALGSLRETVNKVRDSVKYVLTVNACQQRFNDLKLQLQVRSTKSLVLDDQTQWNTTYFMLVAACELKEVFLCLDTDDPNYQFIFTMEEWRQVEALCAILKHLLDAASPLTGPTYRTANVFFDEAWNLQRELVNAAVSDDEFIRTLTLPVHERFNKYWNDCFLVFSIAAVLDPRFKMKLVEFSFEKIYHEDAHTWIKLVNDGARELFLNYQVQMLPEPTFVVDGNGGFAHEEEETVLHRKILKTEDSDNDVFLSTSDGCADLDLDLDLNLDLDLDLDLDLYISTSHENMNPELDQYLEEAILPRRQDFDVLGWWNQNADKYPILSKMACDILCIPLSTVSHDSVFDMTCKKMDRYRSSLRPATTEALVCAKDWLQYGSSDYSPDYSPSVSPKSVMKAEL